MGLIAGLRIWAVVLAGFAATCGGRSDQHNRMEEQQETYILAPGVESVDVTVQMVKEKSNVVEMKVFAVNNPNRDPVEIALRLARSGKLISSVSLYPPDGPGIFLFDLTGTAEPGKPVVVRAELIKPEKGFDKKMSLKFTCRQWSK